MLSVRKYSKNSIVILITMVGVVLLLKNGEVLSRDFFLTMKRLINTRRQLYGFHGHVVSGSFWILILSSVIEAIFSEKSGSEIIGKYGISIVFCLCISVWGIVAMSSSVSPNWFWLSFYLGLIICIRIAFVRISKIRGAGPSTIRSLIKSPPSKNDSSVSIIDRRVLYVTQVIILCDWILIVIYMIMYCLYYKWFFV